MIYALAGLALLCIATAVYFGRVAFKAKDATMAATDRIHAEGKLADEAIAALVKDRDDWKQKADVATQQLAAAKVRLVTAETQRNQSAQAATTALVEKVKASDAQGAADVLNSVLGMRLMPEMPKAGPASPGDGGSGTAGVQPASAAPAATGPRRLP